MMYVKNAISLSWWPWIITSDVKPHLMTDIVARLRPDWSNLSLPLVFYTGL